MLKLSPESFLESAGIDPVIDVRSPAEYNKGHIPGAINVPLFSDEERKVIGTTYKQIGQHEAITLGLDVVGPKMSELVNKVRGIPYENQLLVHCWRGGMRSESFAWLMETCGMKSAVLQGGYKIYRNLHNDFYRSPFELILLTGSTGSGKTEVLKELAEIGEQVIDLEAIAKHKGSVFGGIGNPPQPTCEQFQNNLFGILREMDRSKPIWLEDESISIGDVFIPQEFWQQMKRSPLIKIIVPTEARIDRLVNEYGLFPNEILEEKILKISKRLGGLETKTSLEALRRGDLYTASKQLLTYYDKAYDHATAKKNGHIIQTLPCSGITPQTIAKQLVNTYKKKLATNA